MAIKAALLLALALLAAMNFAALKDCVDHSDCSAAATNGICYTHATLQAQCLCHSGYGDDGSLTACDAAVPSVVCSPAAYDPLATNFANVSVSMAWIGGANDHLQIVVTVPHQQSVMDTLILYVPCHSH